MLSCLLRALHRGRDLHEERTSNVFSQRHTRYLLIHIDRNQPRDRRGYGMARQRLVYLTVLCLTNTHFEQQSLYTHERKDTKSIKFTTSAFVKRLFYHLLVAAKTSKV